MKKSIILSLMAMFALGTVSFAANTSNRNPIPEPAGNGIKLSSIRIGATEDDPIRVFKLVRFTSADAGSPSIASGDVVVYDTNSADGVSVRLTTSSADPAIAGIAVTAIQSADGGSTSAFDDIGHKNWGWICVHGPALVNQGGVNGASVGNIFITSSDPTRVTTVPTLNASTGANGAGSKGGFYLVVGTAGSTSSKVFVELE